jgi:hypothetical protein
MRAMLRKRTGLVVVFAIVFAGLFAPSALANTPLTITKTATAHWTRSYDWTIDKSVDKPVIELQSGSSAIAKYTVAVTKSAGVDSIWVDGTVCVSNSGPLPTEGLVVTDRVVAFHADGTRTLVKSTPIDLSANPVLDPGESHCYPYSFPIEPFANATGYANEARATILNDPREADTPLGPSTEAPFTMPGSPSLVNDAVNVDDTNGMSWPFSASGSKTYMRTFTCDRDKGTHVNTAKIRQTGQSDTATVVVTCKEKPKDCPKGHDQGKGKYKDSKGKHSGYGDRYDRDRDYGHGSSSRGRDDDRCDDNHGGGGHDDDSDDSDSSDDSDDSDDRDCKGDRRGWH